MSTTKAPLYHFFAELIEREVLDTQGRPVGDLHDIAFSLQDHYPRATHLILRRGLLRHRVMRRHHDRSHDGDGDLYGHHGADRRDHLADRRTDLQHQ